MSSLRDATVTSPEIRAATLPFLSITTVEGIALAGKEPLRTLAHYRTMKNKIMFGQNLIAKQGTIRVGDKVSVTQFGYPPNAEF
mgnify:CR=1 FL=1